MIEETQDAPLEENAEEATELELETPTEETPEETPSDPLDEIEDLDELRKRAKGFRSQVSRLKDKPKEELKEEPTEEPPSEYLSKKDFYKSNERKAINELTRVVESDPEDVQARKAFVTENWESIKEYYTPRKGKDTPEDILEDLVDAVTLYSAKHKPAVADPKELAQTTGGGHSSAIPIKDIAVDPPGMKTSTQPKDWYTLSPASEERLKEKGVLKKT